MGAVDCYCPLFLQDMGSHLCLLSTVLDSNPLWRCLLFLLDLPSGTNTPSHPGLFWWFRVWTHDSHCVSSPFWAYFLLGVQ